MQAEELAQAINKELEFWSLQCPGDAAIMGPFVILAMIRARCYRDFEGEAAALP